MTTESDRPPRRINGKWNSKYEEWRRRMKGAKPRPLNVPPKYVNGKLNPENTKYYSDKKAAKVTKKCDCGCGETLRDPNTRCKPGHHLRATQEHEKWIGKLCSPAHRKKVSETGTSKGEKHQKAGVWHLKSPNNVSYSFKNLEHFIRSHAHLFHPDDIVRKLKKNGGSFWCRAGMGLNSLSPRCKNPKGSWKGWRIDSQQERLFHEGKTLLEDTTDQAPPWLRVPVEAPIDAPESFKWKASSSTNQETPPP
jgi:hypothetical protein